MADKVSAGQPIPRSAALWNNIIGAANDFARRRLGEPRDQASLAVPTDVVKIKNSTGSLVRLGEIMEISGFLLTDVLRTALWFDGTTPDTTRPFAIVLQNMPTGVIDRAQVSGVCVALVNVTDEAHGYAAPADGEPVLQSAASGPIRILYKPPGTAEALCAVVFAAEGGNRKPLVRFTLDAAMSTNGATAEATITNQYGPGVDHDTAVTITVHNLLTHTGSVYLFEGDANDAGLAHWDSGTDFIITQMECP